VEKRVYNINNLKKPLVIPLSGLEVLKDNNSEYGLAFKLTDKAQIIVAPILSKNNGSYIDSSEMNSETGLPNCIFTNAKPGNRQLWTRGSGLSRLLINGDLDLDSKDTNLFNSGSYGRIVLVNDKLDSRILFGGRK
ncbi:MAG: hypothetical protein WCK29_01405, partial [archaeon]